MSFFSAIHCETKVSPETGFCYWMPGTPAQVTRFRVAVSRCIEEGGSLAILDSQEAVGFVLQHLRVR